MQVNDKTPPAFLFHSTDDGVVQIKNPQAYYDSLRKHSIPSSFMKFDHGGHGFGMADGKEGKSYDAVLNSWCDSSLKWLDKQGFFQAKTTVLVAPPSPFGVEAHIPISSFKGHNGHTSDALGRRQKAMRSLAESEKR
jgi:hypothetical protein